MELGAKDKMFRKGRSSVFLPAIAELKRSLEVAVTNGPIKRKSGDTVEAGGDRRDAKSFKAAIAFLGKGK